MRRAAVLYAALTAGVVAFQLALVLGAPLGHLTMGGRWPGVLPTEGRITAGLSALLLTSMAMVVLGRAGLLAVRPSTMAIWLVVALQGLGVVAHVMTPSAAERALWLPVILVLLACALVVARRSHSPER